MFTFLILSLLAVLAVAGVPTVRRLERRRSVERAVAPLLAFHRATFGGATMAATLTTDVASFIPAIISASLYDTMLASDHPLSSVADRYTELEGAAGDRLTIPTLAVTSAATNLAENVVATDDALTSGGVTVTIKEAVKSIGYSDRTRIQSGQPISQIAGQRVGNAINDRVELDLGAALLAGRNVAADTALGATLDLADLRTLRAKVPVRLRRRGLVVVASADVLDGLLSDSNVANAATFGSDEAIRNGGFSRPLYGMELLPVDDGTLANITVGATTGPPVVVFARGMLVRAMQKEPSSEVERDARARLTRVVGTALHAEGVMESAGVVAGVIG